MKRIKGDEPITSFERKAPKPESKKKKDAPVNTPSLIQLSKNQEKILARVLPTLPQDIVSECESILRDIGENFMHGLTASESIEIALIIGEEGSVNHLKPLLTNETTKGMSKEFHESHKHIQAFLKISEVAYKKSIISSAVLAGATDKRILKGLMDDVIKKQEEKNKEDGVDKAPTAGEILQDWYNDLQSDPTPINMNGNNN